MPRLHGGERADAALHVARALADWNRRARSGEAGAKEDIAFWRDRREGFTSAAAFAQVIEALLVQQDWRASLALLIAWLSESANVPLEDGTASFHDLSARWLDGALASPDRDALVPRFFALLAGQRGGLVACARGSRRADEPGRRRCVRVGLRGGDVQGLGRRRARRRRRGWRSPSRAGILA